MGFYSLAAIATAATLALGPATQAAQAARSSSPGAVQVTGTSLASAMLPAAAFGPGAYQGGLQTSGSKLRHDAADNQLFTLSCYDFWILFNVPGISGQTAWASESVYPGSTSANDFQPGYTQTVGQFAGPRAASAYYGKVLSKISGCRSYTIPDIHNPVHMVLRYLTRTRIDGHPAFFIGQVGTFSGVSGHLVQYLEIAADGADVFTAEFSDQTAGAPDAPPAHPTLSTIARDLIARVSALR
jgi:hypothetical protein